MSESGAHRQRSAGDPDLVRPGSMLAAGTATAAAAGGLSALVDGRAGWWPVGAAVVALCVLLCLAGLTRRRARAAVTVLIAGWFIGLPIICVVVTIIYGWSAPQGWRWFGDAWQDLLAGPTPAATAAAPVLALVVTGWVAAGLAVLATLAGRGSLLALLPAAGLLVLAGVIAAPRIWLAPAVVAAMGLYLVFCRPPGGPAEPSDSPQVQAGSASRTTQGTPARRRNLPALALLSCCVAISVLVGQALPAAEPTARAAPQAETASGTSPLVWVTAWQSAPARPVFKTSAASAPLRWATLQRYDGSTWRSEGTFTLTGPTTRLSGDAPTHMSAVATEISDLALPGRWLPSPGRPDRVDGGPVLLDPATGDLFARATGDPSTYTVEAAIPAPGERRLRAAEQQVRTAQQVHADDPTSPVLAQQARDATAGAASDYDRLAALAQWCRQDLHHDPKVVPGQSIRVLEEVANSTRPGTADQIVGAYALMARTLGYPTRVVVGFAPQSAGQVLSTDVVAWPEVYLDGIGWYPFYPVALPGVDADVQIVRNAVVSVPRAPQAVAVQPAPAAAVAARTPTSPGHVLVWAAVGILLGAVLCAAAAGSVVWAWRARSRRARTPSEQLLQEWNQLQRSLSRSLGISARALTSEQLVNVVAESGGPGAAAAAQALGDIVTRVLYGGGVVDDGEVAAARRGSRIVRTAVRRSTRRWGPSTSVRAVQR